MKKISLMIFGFLICIVGILLGPVARLTSMSIERPWVDGFLVNTWRSFKKYTFVSWVRWIVSIYRKPELIVQYLGILFTKKKVVFVGKKKLETQSLLPQHMVFTDHKHHRDRVSDIKKGNLPSSNFGAILIVDNAIHDGHHRIEAFREAGIEEVEVSIWKAI